MLKRVLVLSACAALAAALFAPGVAMAVGWEMPAASVTRASGHDASVTYRASEADGGWTEVQVIASDQDVFRVVGIKPHVSTVLSPYGFVAISRYYPATADSLERLVESSGWSTDEAAATIDPRRGSAWCSFVTEPLSWAEYEDVMPWEDEGARVVRWGTGEAVSVDGTWVAADGDSDASRSFARFRERDYRYNMIASGESLPAMATLTVTGESGTGHASVVGVPGTIDTWRYKENSTFHLRPGDYEQ